MVIPHQLQMAGAQPHHARPLGSTSISQASAGSDGILAHGSRRTALSSAMEAACFPDLRASQHRCTTSLCIFLPNGFLLIEGGCAVIYTNSSHKGESQVKVLFSLEIKNTINHKMPCYTHLAQVEFNEF